MERPKAFVGVTDGDWFEMLRAEHARTALEEVNFWQPSGRTAFPALLPGEPFLFELHSPRNFVVGGGFFAWFSQLPVPLAWESFGRRNGVVSLDLMWRRIAGYRRDGATAAPSADPRPIGCIMLAQPFFFAEADWIRSLRTGPRTSFAARATTFRSNQG